MIKAWVEAMRLRTLPVSVAGVVAACAYALSDGAFSPVPALLCLVFAVLCQVASNFANEYYDFKAGRDRAGREGPRRGVTEGDISARAMKAAVFGTLGVAALVGLSLVCYGGWWLIAVGAAVGIGALAYSTGPYPLSTHCLGEVAVIAFFGVVPVTMTYYVQALHFTVPVLCGAVAVGLMGANVLIVNNTRDIPDDRAVGKHTLATAMGIAPMCVLYVLNAAVAVALTWTFWRGAWIAAPAAYLGASTAIAIFLYRLRGARLTPLLGLTSLLMFAYALTMLLSRIG